MSRYNSSSRSSARSQEPPFILIKPNEFNPDELVLGPYTKKTYPGDKTKSSFSTERSPLLYQGKKLMVEFPEQIVWGPGWSHQAATGGSGAAEGEEPQRPQKEEKKVSVATRTGIQQTYPLTSAGTVNAPTEEEQEVFTFLELFHERVRQLVTDYCRVRRDGELRANLRTAIFGASKTLTEAIESEDEDAIAEARQAWGEVMRFLARPPKEPVDKNGNPKPTCMYLPLVTYKKGAELTVASKYFDLDDEPVDIIAITKDFGEGSVRGALKPVADFPAVTWGGKNFSFGIKSNLIQAQWNELESTSSVPEVSLFSGGTARPIETFKPRGNVAFVDEAEEAEEADEGDVAPPPKSSKAKAPSKASKTKASSKKAPPPEEVYEEDEVAPPPKASKAKASSKRTPPPEEEVYEEDEEVEVAPPPKASKAKAKASSKRAPPPEEEEVYEEDDEVEVAPPPKASKAKAKASSKRAPPPEEEVYEEDEVAPPPKASKAKAKASSKRAPPPEEEEVYEEEEY